MHLLAQHKHDIGLLFGMFVARCWQKQMALKLLFLWESYGSFGTY